MKDACQSGRCRRAVLAGALAVCLPWTAQAAEPKKTPIEQAAETAFWNGDFAALERQNDTFKQPNRFDPDGRSQLSQFRNGVESLFNNDVDNAEPYFAEIDALTLEWAERKPASPLAHILHVKALIKHGWSYRGTRYDNQVPKEAMKEFHTYLKRAFDYLKAHADVALKDSYAHAQLIEIGMNLEWSKAQLGDIFQDGLKRNPDDVDLYSEMAFALLPKWDGTPRQLDAFITRATEQTRARFGMGMYAYLYEAAAANQFGPRLFESSGADWHKMKQGYEDWNARYPGNAYRMNAYAHMACVAKDKPAFRKAIGLADAQADLEAWGDNPDRTRELCRRWAAQP